MNPALLFLLRRSLLNRLLAMAARLRQPRYLLPALVGMAYFALIFNVNGGGTRSPPQDAPAAGGGGAGASALAWIGAALVLGSCVLSWLFPGKHGGLVFLEAEVALLFPAPLRRRDLVLYKIAAMQPPLLFSALITSFFALRSRGGGGGAYAMGVAGMLLALNAITLHNIGASFARMSMAAHGRAGWRRQWPVPATLLAVAVAIALLFPPLSRADGPAGWVRALDASPLAIVLYPALCLARVAVAPDVTTFLLHVGPAILVTGLLAAWVLRADVAFEEAAAEFAEVFARRIAAMRAGRMTDPSLVPRAATKPAPWRLPSVGPAEGAFVWKASTAVVRGTSVRAFAALFVVIVIVVAAFEAWLRSSGGPPVPLLAGICAAFAGLAVLIGPAVTPASLRHDLEYATLLKGLPVSGARLIRGEVLGAAAPILAVQGLLLVIAAVAVLPALEDAPGSGAEGGLSPAWALAGLIGMAPLLGAMTLFSTAIDGALAVLFPAWLRPVAGEYRPAGTEAIGQNILAFLAKGFALSLALAAGGLVGGASAAAAWILGPEFLRPVAAAVGGVLAAAVVTGATWLLCSWLGDRFDALDPAEEALA